MHLSCFEEEFQKNHFISEPCIFTLSRKKVGEFYTCFLDLDNFESEYNTAAHSCIVFIPLLLVL
jgi:hypothetical protein